ncbi:hypothetical protein KOI40_13745 [Aestuariicella sp. G3-2]|uniref:hypothetical protein n=1 Tax=Pseudomaricurvus albidus TaxID=2842452 RepID=UPI001C0C7D17|nr:hypothetical protein [Aestuariicella albida]MBU3070885.1 hypothetical protein [Aestuariicella albida]
MPLNNRHLKLSFLASLITMLSLTSQHTLASNEAPWVGDTLTGAPCIGRPSGYGPYDYLQRNRLAKNLRLVEGAHFDRNVEALTGGAKGKGKDPIPDLDYTLRAFPNHHRALNTIIRHDLTKPKESYNKGATPAECYLQRAINFSPKDAISYMLYGILLHRTNNYVDALMQYDTAKTLAPENGQILYNLSLLLVDLERYEEARSYAKKIYARGFPLQGLKKQLQSAGYWDKPQK